MDELRGDFQSIDAKRGILVVRGLVTQEQVSEVLQMAVDAATGQPYYLLVADIREMAGQSPEARKVTVTYFRQMPPFVIAVVANTFAQRAIGKLVIKASNLLNTDSGNLQTSDFFKTLEQAHAWLDKRAEKFEAELA